MVELLSLILRCFGVMIAGVIFIWCVGFLAWIAFIKEKQDEVEKETVRRD